MLDRYFKAPWCLSRLHRGPIGPHIDDIATCLHKSGYRASTARPILRATARFSAFAESMGITESCLIQPALIERFLNDLERQKEHSYPHARRAMNDLTEHLQELAIFPSPAPTQIRETDADSLLARYDRYLVKVRELPKSTRADYGQGAQRLVLWLQDKQNLRDLRQLRGSHVLAYITDLAGRYKTRSWRNRLTSQTRIFLRFLRGDGIIKDELDRAVPKLAYYRLSSIPRHLDWHIVRDLIDSIDTADAVGKRDKVVLLLTAVLGMRGSSVRTLELENIRWRSGEIYLPKTKNQRAQVLPIPQEVGEALADYILNGRPESEDRNVILRHHPPVRPLVAPGAVSRIVRRRLQRLSVPMPNRPGVHLLRHSLATRMVNTGAPIKQIADLLGHRSINTTAIYTKVDTVGLARVPLVFPGVAV